MKKTIIILTCLLATLVSANSQQQTTKAEQIIKLYLEMPNSEDIRYGEEREKREAILDKLKSLPDDAVEEIGRILPEVKNPLQRIELAETLGLDLQTKKSAEILCGLLKDTDEKVRWQAIHSLRLLSRQTDRIGPSRMQRLLDTRSGNEKEKAARQALLDGQPIQGRQEIQPNNERLQDFVEFAPKVEGLVPFLISAANDKVESNRICALYALADSRDNLAVTELRNRLKDTSQKVRLFAACFLTEYQDASGLHEMKSALERLSKTNPEMPDDVFEFYNQAEMLLASFERITGKSFGRIPMNPNLSSSINQTEQIKTTYNLLLKNWTKWWTWEPKPEGL